MKELNTFLFNKISKNLTAFNFNFGDIQILRDSYSGRFFVFQGINEQQDNYIWHTDSDSIEELNGWLYGAVQAHCKRIKAKEA